MTIDCTHDSTLISELQTSGFPLEWRTASVFIKNQFTVEQSLLLSNSHDEEYESNQLTDIDVFAFEGRGADGPNPYRDAYIVECKGAEQTSRLALFPTPLEPGNTAKNLSFPSIIFTENYVYFDNQNNIHIDYSKPENLTYCNTGDFINL